MSNKESGSSISTWLTCPKRYEYEYVKGYQQPQSDALSFGTEIHKYAEAANKGGLVLTDAKESKIVEKWHKYWSASSSIYKAQNLEFLDVESEWSMDLDEYELVGKRDGYVKHSSGKHFLYELKTAAFRDVDTYMRLLESNAQISNNMLALDREGKPVDGAIYDIIWKPAIRQKKHETNEEFEQRYVDEFDNGDKYFARTVIFRKASHIVRHVSDLAQVLESMQHPAYRNTTSCMKYNKLCPFFDACVDDDDSKLEGFEKKDRKHVELSEAIQ